VGAKSFLSTNWKVIFVSFCEMGWFFKGFEIPGTSGSLILLLSNIWIQFSFLL
jgi:hypothetical protein